MAVMTGREREAVVGRRGGLHIAWRALVGAYGRADLEATFPKKVYLTVIN